MALLNLVNPHVTQPQLRGIAEVAAPVNNTHTDEATDPARRCTDGAAAPGFFPRQYDPESPRSCFIQRTLFSVNNAASLTRNAHGVTRRTLNTRDIAMKWDTVRTRYTLRTQDTFMMWVTVKKVRHCQNVERSHVLLSCQHNPPKAFAPQF